MERDSKRNLQLNQEIALNLFAPLSFKYSDPWSHSYMPHPRLIKFAKSLS